MESLPDPYKDLVPQLKLVLYLVGFSDELQRVRTLDIERLVSQRLIVLFPQS